MNGAQAIVIFGAIPAILALASVLLVAKLRDKPPQQPEHPLTAARHRVTDSGERPGDDDQFSTWPNLRVPDSIPEPACPSSTSPGDGRATTEVS